MKLKPNMSQRLSNNFILQTNETAIKRISTSDLKSGTTCKNLIYCDPQTANSYTTSATRMHLLWFFKSYRMLLTANFLYVTMIDFTMAVHSFSGSNW